jgi:hypothetical protein
VVIGSGIGGMACAAARRVRLPLWMGAAVFLTLLFSPSPLAAGRVVICGLNPITEIDYATSPKKRPEILTALERQTHVPRATIERAFAGDEAAGRELSRGLLNHPIRPVPLLGPGLPIPVRVAAPGNRADLYRSFDDLQAVPTHYRSDSRFQELSTDPAHLDHGPNFASRNEAMTGLEAEQLGILVAPISRGPAEIEFYDGAGHPWDVKTTPSPGPNGKFTFRAAEVGQAILNQFRYPTGDTRLFENLNTRVFEPIRILLNATYLTPEDHGRLWLWLRQNLTEAELARIYELNLRIP